MSLEKLAQTIVASPKGILAADWSVGTATKKFARFGINSTEESRRDYRQMLFEAEGLENYISAIILHEETIRQKTKEGKPLVELIKEKGIIPGVRIDIGQEEIPGFEGEQITFGLDKIRSRLSEFKSLGTSFAKWRAAFFVGRGKPSRQVIEANSILLSLYALFCIEADILPIVEPDVVMDGNHSLSECAQATEEVLKILFFKLSEYGVDRKKILLKPSMVLPGKDAPKALASDIASFTLTVFKKIVPVDVCGIAFLSGGQSLDEACQNLNEIAKKSVGFPWQITFSFARALQEPVLAAWQGKEENRKQAQEKLLESAKKASLARQGRL